MKVIQWETTAVVMTVLTRGRLPWSTSHQPGVGRVLLLGPADAGVDGFPGGLSVAPEARARGCSSAGDEARLLLH